MPSFQGDDIIRLQPNDSGLVYRFEFTQTSSNTANDGFLPPGTTVSGITVTAHKEDGTDATSDLIDTGSAVNNNIATIPLKYPGSEGIYHIRIICALDDGSTVEADFNRVKAEDL